MVRGERRAVGGGFSGKKVAAAIITVMLLIALGIAVVRLSGSPDSTSTAGTERQRSEARTGSEADKTQPKRDVLIFAEPNSDVNQLRQRMERLETQLVQLKSNAWDTWIKGGLLLLFLLPAALVAVSIYWLRGIDGSLSRIANTTREVDEALRTQQSSVSRQQNGGAEEGSRELKGKLEELRQTSELTASELRGVDKTLKDGLAELCKTISALGQPTNSALLAQILDMETRLQDRVGNLEQNLHVLTKDKHSVVEARAEEWSETPEVRIAAEQDATKELEGVVKIVVQKMNGALAIEEHVETTMGLVVTADQEPRVVGDRAEEKMEQRVVTQVDPEGLDQSNAEFAMVKVLCLLYASLFQGSDIQPRCAKPDSVFSSLSPFFSSQTEEKLRLVVQKWRGLGRDDLRQMEKDLRELGVDVYVPVPGSFDTYGCLVEHEYHSHFPKNYVIRTKTPRIIYREQEIERGLVVLSKGNEWPLG